MKEVGIDQKRLAQEARVTESCISYILSGKRNPSISTAQKIAAALDLELGELIDILYLKRKR
jgi:transcriptional regulator with XRE-family HTH domain